MGARHAVAALGLGAALLSPAVPLAGQVRGAPAGQRVTLRPWPPERLPDGQPDVQGFWRAVDPAGAWGLNIEPLPNMMGDKGKVSAGIVVDPADGHIPYLPWARARRDEEEARDGES